MFAFAFWCNRLLTPHPSSTLGPGNSLGGWSTRHGAGEEQGRSAPSCPLTPHILAPTILANAAAYGRIGVPPAAAFWVREDSVGREWIFGVGEAGLEPGRGCVLPN